MAADVSGYNVQGYIHKLETLRRYEFPFERLKRVEEQYAGKKKKVKDEQGVEKEVDASSSDEEEEKKKEEEEQALEEIKESQNEDDENAEEEPPKDERDPALILNERIAKEGKSILDKMKQPPKTINLNDVDEEEARLESASTAASENQQRSLLDGFVQSNIKIHFLSGKLEKLTEKKKYKNLFDLGVLSV